MVRSERTEHMAYTACRLMLSKEEGLEMSVLVCLSLNVNSNRVWLAKVYA